MTVTAHRTSSTSASSIADTAAVLNAIAHASEALALCAGLAKDAGVLAKDHEAAQERGREAIRVLGEAAITAAIA